MTRFFTRILLIISGAMLIAGAVFAQNNTNTRQVRFFPVVTAADTAATSANQGRIWYDFSTDHFRANVAGTNTMLGEGSGGGGSFWATTGTTNVTTPTISGSVTYSGGRVSFTPNATTAGLSVGTFAGNPSTPIEGDLWLNTSNSRIQTYFMSAVRQIMYGSDGAASTNGIPVFVGGTSGRITTDANFTYSSSTLNAPFIRLTPSATTSGLNVGSLAGDPSVTNNGDAWYNSSTHRLKVKVNSSNVSLVTSLSDVGVAISGGSISSGSPPLSYITGTSASGTATEAGQLQVVGGSSNVTGVKGGPIQLVGGSASTGNADGGDVYIDGGEDEGSGQYGNVAFFARTIVEPVTFSGERVIFIGNSLTQPSVNPTGGAYMYAQAGSIRARGSSGTVTTFAPADPHCPSCGSDFVCEYENEKYGYLAMCFKCMAENMNKPKRKRKPFFTTTKGAWSTHK